MNRRSALLAAGGIMLAVVVAIAAIMAGLVGPQPAGADAASSQRPTPRVRTITRTIEVHRPGGTVTVPPSAGTETVSDADRDDAFEQEDGEVEQPSAYEDDDGYEHEDAGDDA